MGTKTLVGCSVTPRVLTGAVLAALVWGGSTYVRLTRDEVRLEQAWAQMENVWLHRRQLVPDLVDLAGETSAAGSHALADLAASADQATSFVVTPELLDDPERCRAFLMAQDRLQEDVSRLLAEFGDVLDRHAPGPVARIRGQLDVTDERLDGARQRFNQAVGAYNESLGRFPQRLLAPLFDFRSRDPWRSKSDPVTEPQAGRP